MTYFCQLCLKNPTVGFNRPKSLHKTKRIVKPNLHKLNGVIVCNRCRRLINKTTAKNSD